MDRNGFLDGTFNPNGGVSGNAATVNALAVQTDGKVLLGGSFTMASGAARGNLARLDPNGTLDATLVPASEAANQPVTQLLVQADGKVLVVNSASRLFRLNADGSLDAGFALDPRAPLPGSQLLLAVRRVLASLKSTKPISCPRGLSTGPPASSSGPAERSRSRAW